MTIKRFEEMKIWQDARSFTKFIYELTATAVQKRLWIEGSDSAVRCFGDVKYR